MSVKIGRISFIMRGRSVWKLPFLGGRMGNVAKLAGLSHLGWPVRLASWLATWSAGPGTLRRLEMYLSSGHSVVLDTWTMCLASLGVKNLDAI
jgi:hypothetical protein